MSAGIERARWVSPRFRGSGRAFHRSFRRWLIAWAGAPVLAIVNGAIREVGYKERAGDSTADQISVASLLVLLTMYFWVLQRRWPIQSNQEAVSVGAIWAALSVAFEFGFGRVVEGDSWSDLVGAYDVTEGRMFILIPVWVAVGPAVIRALASGSPRGSLPTRKG